MRLGYTERFRRAYRALSDQDARRVDRAIRLLADNPRHPGLRVKKIQATESIWEARAGRALRLTFEMHGDALILRNLGLHDEALRNP